MPKDQEAVIEDLRCLCGSLVAKVRKEGIELKCRRCKRVALIPFSGDDQAFLEENHPDIFRHQITFDHSHVDRWGRSESAEGSDGSR